jgi:cation diffusion facilitator CzcD-associated flavoprotein CzcO
VYSGSREIYAYFDAFAEKYNLKHYIKTEHQVIGAYWDNATGGYDVKIRDLNSGQEISNHCDILVNASGILNNWRWPAIPGLQDYKGTLLHTANWDDRVDLTGKHVGLIGNGYENAPAPPPLLDIV